jgi:hypothetical protein
MPWNSGSIPQLQGDIFVRTPEGVDWRPGARLGHLSNDTRGASCRCHHVGERGERAVSFTIGRRRFSVVDVLAIGPVFGVAWERSLGLSSGNSSGRGRRLGEGRRGSKGRRGLVLRSVARLVALVVGVSRREVERREGRGIRGYAGGAQRGVDARGCRHGAGRAGAGAVAGVRRQRSDYGQAVCAGSLRARQGAGVLSTGREASGRGAAKGQGR